MSFSNHDFDLELLERSQSAYDIIMIGAQPMLTYTVLHTYLKFVM